MQALETKSKLSRFVVPGSAIRSSVLSRPQINRVISSSPSFATKRHCRGMRERPIVATLSLLPLSPFVSGPRKRAKHLEVGHHPLTMGGQNYLISWRLGA